MTPIEKQIALLDEQIAGLNEQKVKLYEKHRNALMEQLAARGIKAGSFCRHTLCEGRIATNFYFAGLQCRKETSSGGRPLMYDLLAHHRTPTGRLSKKTYLVGVVLSIDEIQKL